MNLKVAAVSAAFLLGGCAGLINPHGYYIPPPRPTTGAGYQPLIDNAGPNHSADLSECQERAKSEDSSAAFNGAVGGAPVGVALDAIAGGGHAAGYSGFGALEGGVSGAARASENQKQIIINCMRGRGYSVLR
jgi:outer membrane lipoprotein SlyB